MSAFVALPDELVDYLDEQVRSGRYVSRSDVVAEALRAHGCQGAELERIAWLKTAVQAGIDSGEFTDLNLSELKKQARRRYAGLSE